MSWGRTVAIFAFTFCAVWLFALIIEAVTYLRMPNPLLWEPSSRAIAMIEALGIAAMSTLISRLR